ncbi:radical SAM protein [Elusimicrobiota bacterium]
MKDKNFNCQYLVLWELTRACNFNCKYCNGKKRESIYPVSGRNRMIDILIETRRDWIIELSGGEPFLCPDIIDFSEKLTKYFHIALSTNLSISDKVKAFAGRINPDKVKYIYASLHIEEREKLGSVEEFIYNVTSLKKKGFNIHVNYVMHPALIGRFTKDYSRFADRGIILSPRAFTGWYKGKIYPQSYSPEEKDLILEYKPSAEFYPYHFKGIKCDAGIRLLRINEDSTVNPCVGDRRIIGDVNTGIKFYDEPRRCRSYVCPCRGLDLIHTKGISRRISSSNFRYILLSGLRGKYSVGVIKLIRQAVFSVLDSRVNVLKKYRIRSNIENV